MVSYFLTRRGRARLELIPSVNCPLADLPVREVIGGLQMVTDMTLPYGKVIHDYPAQSHEMLFDAHTRSFAALGGVARRGIYDNMKTAVDKVKKGKERVVNARFT